MWWLPTVVRLQFVTSPSDNVGKNRPWNTWLFGGRQEIAFGISHRRKNGLLVISIRTRRAPHQQLAEETNTFKLNLLRGVESAAENAFARSRFDKNVCLWFFVGDGKLIHRLIQLTELKALGASGENDPVRRGASRPRMVPWNGLKVHPSFA